MTVLLFEQLRSVSLPGIIAVSGFGGSGKSSLATQIGATFHSPVISVDSFIRDRHLTHYTQWDFIDYERLEREVLLPFSAGVASIEFGHFDWSSNRIGSYQTLRSCPQIVVEGVGLFRPSLLRYFAFTIWVECPLEEAIRRGKWRDREVYNSPQDQNWDGVWRDNDVECYRLYKPEQIADAVYDNSAPKV